MIEKKRVFGYVRVSTREQVEKATYENQIKSIKDYAKEENLEIVEIFQDLAISGVNQNRKSLQVLLERINEVEGIIIYDLDRLSRDFEFSISLMFLLKNKHKTLYISRTRQKQTFSDKTEQLINVIYSWVADLEREKIKQRQKLGIERFKQENGRWGRKKKEINWKEYDFLINQVRISKAAFCRMKKISQNTLYRRLKEREKK